MNTNRLTKHCNEKFADLPAEYVITFCWNWLFHYIQAAEKKIEKENITSVFLSKNSSNKMSFKNAVTFQNLNLVLEH